MKTHKTKKGYYYKEYKNGKKKRISRIEYDKLRKKSNKKQKGGTCYHTNIGIHREIYNWNTEYIYRCKQCGYIFEPTTDNINTFKKTRLNRKKKILE